ncbi:TIGR02301 family protein [Hyphomonadaceae bacterium ML37]|nr:TIGR02301 family protein [Hyphomonadaceae bacterium ML37]
MPYALRFVTTLRGLLVSFCLIALAAAPTSARQESDPYPVESLARIMGELHGLTFACQGRQAQTWRTAMAELLDYEAPTAGTYRARLIDRFNEGFRHQERLRLRCGAESEYARQQLAEQGRAFSNQLRRTYLD